jgi:hypothetical protein
MLAGRPGESRELGLELLVLRCQLVEPVKQGLAVLLLALLAG